MLKKLLRVFCRQERMTRDGSVQSDRIQEERMVMQVDSDSAN